MPTQNKQPKPDFPNFPDLIPEIAPDQDPGRLKKLGAKVLAGAAVIGVSAAALLGGNANNDSVHAEHVTEVEITAPETDTTVPEEVIVTETYETTSLTEQLGGRSLTQEVIDNQMSSSILLEGPAGLEGVMGQGCSGNITVIDGKRYITSAKHCIGQLTSSSEDAIYVLDPATHERIARLDDIAVAEGATDLFVATTTEESPEYLAKQARSITEAPRPGDEVATYGAAYGTDGSYKAQSLEGGVYLGRYTYEDGETGEVIDLDVVGYTQANTSVVLGGGRSGGSSESAGGGAFGPQLFSITEQSSDELRYGNEEFTGIMTDIQIQTGVDLKKNNIVSVAQHLHVEPEQYQQLARSL